VSKDASHKRQFLSEEEFRELWEDRGFLYRLWELWEFLGQNGMRLPQNNFISHMEKMLSDFLVNGDHRQHPKERRKTIPHWWRNI